ncbi:DUF2249 domain-containing protein [Ramlibacter sp.]|uniref:DUF2249 domain-containing protein n=1 Tax=Ramlibacter sp. TaxID=1917967 RepID=UPI002D05EEA2|nr:DUF2249 domain-containing protein [Ramlibacter sp.]HWI80440.1 DUF2249 domain-containing protein [Ramlibacter sp.]
MTSAPLPACCPPPGGDGSVPPAAAPREWHEQGASHVDVRGLVPPQPLVAILKRVRSAPGGETVIAHLDRDPMLLYPELAELGWEAARIAGEPGEVRLLLRRIA